MLISKLATQQIVIPVNLYITSESKNARIVLFMEREDTAYFTIIESLKEKIRLAKQRAILAVNKELIQIYWEIGNTILQQQAERGWGAKVIDKLSADLKSEFPDMKGFSVRNIKYMKAFAAAYPLFMQQSAAQSQSAEKHNLIIVQQLAAQLPWTHHQVLLDKLKTTEEREFYIKMAIENGWSRGVLAIQIDSQLHIRQGNAITNFEHTLPKTHSDLAKESIKNPYLFDFLSIGEHMQERELEAALIQHIKRFMLELGRGFSYVGNQYNLKVEDDDFYLDLLFFNYHLDCFVVFELKVGEFKPEYTGKLNFYINTIDEKIKETRHKPTIGVLLCKTPNETVVKYALRGIATPMGVAEYEFTRALPKQLKGEMPTIEELEKEIEKETNEFKELQNPVDARLRAIKEKLKEIKTDEIQTPVSFKILHDLFSNGLKPLYQKLIDKLFKEFHEEFVTQSLHWTFNQQSVIGLDEVKQFWDSEENLRKSRVLDFTYQLNGFKKGGANDFGESQTLRFEWREYWWGFTLLHHNNDQPFIKKLYHQALSIEDQQQIIELMMTKVMDRIEWILAFMNSK